MTQRSILSSEILSTERSSLYVIILLFGKTEELYWNSCKHDLEKIQLHRITKNWWKSFFDVLELSILENLRNWQYRAKLTQDQRENPFQSSLSKVENQTVQTLQREREGEREGSGMVTKVKSSEFQFARRRDPCVYLATANIPPCKSSNPFPFLSPFPFYPLVFSFFFFFPYHSLRVAASLSLNDEAKEFPHVLSIRAFLSRLSCIKHASLLDIMRAKWRLRVLLSMLYLSVRSIVCWMIEELFKLSSV